MATHFIFGSANLTGAGIGMKGEGTRNFEAGPWPRSTTSAAAKSRMWPAIMPSTPCCMGIRLPHWKS